MAFPLLYSIINRLTRRMLKKAASKAALNKLRTMNAER